MVARKAGKIGKANKIDRIKIDRILAAAAIVALAVFAAAYYVIFVLPGEEAGHATATSTSTTTVQTTTTVPAPETVDRNILWLESRVHELVNAERAARGLRNLTWDASVAAVARGHSADMAVHDYFSHTGLDGSNLTTRLYAGNVYYWNLSAENILKSSKIKFYLVDRFGNIVDITYDTWEELASGAVGGWMNSTHHRENILNGNLTHAGVGIAAAGDKNESYYFTQDFVEAVDCGYRGGVCCETEGYMPWCYLPWECDDGLCK